MAYAGFLRMGEFTYKNEPLDVQAARRLTRADVTFAEDDSYYTITLRQSKTDRHFEGVSILIAAAEQYCPVVYAQTLHTGPTISGYAIVPLIRRATVLPHNRHLLHATKTM